MNERFKTARTVLAFIELTAWLIVALGAIGLVLGFQERNPMPMVGAGAVLIGLGLTYIVLTQLARAQIATANGTDRTVELLKQLVEMQTKNGGAPPLTPSRASDPEDRASVSRGGYRNPRREPQVSRQSTADAEPGDEVYRGELIKHRAGRYVVNGESFATAAQARSYVHQSKKG